MKPAAVCQIRDEGIGIPTEDQARLFTAFHRGRNVEHVAGTGLGLLIVKRCIELHGGRIACESNEGSGTTFTVWLPLYDGGASHH
jgi:signal transduction histidine kinase